ncbi:MAG: InlB B-repeat-containing protein, partial [Candidatus Promineifilaceae bacterium]
MKKKQLINLLALSLLAVAIVLQIGPAAADSGYSVSVTISPSNPVVGTVSSDPQDTTSLTEGEYVELTATVTDPGYSFVGWSDDPLGVFTGTENPITRQVTGAHNVVATFAPTCYELTPSVSPSGWGSISAPDSNAACPEPYQYLAGSTINVTAVANDGYKFSQWTGPDAPADPDNKNATIQITMDANKALTATFVEACQLVTLSRNIEAGGGVPTANPKKISCPTDYHFKAGE